MASGMIRIEIDANTKGMIGESLISGKRSPPDPIVEELFEFLSGFNDVGDHPKSTARVRRSVYFNATDKEAEKLVWNADRRITISWSSAAAQEDTDSEFGRYDIEAVFPVDVKTGEYETLERSQKDVARAIATTPNNVFPSVISVSIEELPETVDATVKIPTSVATLPMIDTCEESSAKPHMDVVITDKPVRRLRHTHRRVRGRATSDRRDDS